MKSGGNIARTFRCRLYIVAFFVLRLHQVAFESKTYGDSSLYGIQVAHMILVYRRTLQISSYIPSPAQTLG